jgi:hypothetical protein
LKGVNWVHLLRTGTSGRSNEHDNAQLGSKKYEFIVAEILLLLKVCVPWSFSFALRTRIFSSSKSGFVLILHIKTTSGYTGTA